MYRYILSEKWREVKGESAERARKMGLFKGFGGTEGAALRTL